MEHRHITEGSLVGKLITYDLMRSKPTDKDAGEKSHHREEKLTCNKIKHVKVDRGCLPGGSWAVILFA